MLGLIYRITYGQAPDQLTELFPLQERSSRYNTRLESCRHRFQIIERSFRTDVFQRSIFGLIVIWNLLPEDVNISKSVHLFQSKLQKALKKAIALDIDRWQMIFSPVERVLDVFRFQALFSAA